jgi:hypothetical protein
MQELNRFRELFWDAFHVPDLTSEKFKKKWNELEGLNDRLAGPLFSIYEKGDADYIFKETDRFPGLKTEEDLFEWLTENIREYAEKAAELKPENEDEERDLKILMYQTDIKMELADLSLEILTKRNHKEE